MKIRYEFLTGDVIEVEVSDIIGNVSIEIDHSINNSDRGETRRHNSLDSLAQQGIQIAADNNEVVAIIEAKETMEILHVALGNLLPQENKLVNKVFYDGMSIADVARDEGVSEGAIRDRLRKIYKKIKINLK